MKITSFSAVTQGQKSVKGIGKAVVFSVGQQCVNEFGGGKISDITINRATHSIEIRKNNGQFRKAGGESPPEVFDAVCVPLLGVNWYTIQDEPQDKQQGQPQQKKP